MNIKSCHPFLGIEPEILITGDNTPSIVDCGIDLLFLFFVISVGINVALHFYYIIKKKIYGFAWPPEDWGQFSKNPAERLIGKIYTHGTIAMLLFICFPIMLLTVAAIYFSFGALLLMGLEQTWIFFKSLIATST